MEQIIVKSNSLFDEFDGWEMVLIPNTNYYFKG